MHHHTLPGKVLIGDILIPSYLHLCHQRGSLWLGYINLVLPNTQLRGSIDLVSPNLKFSVRPATHLGSKVAGPVRGHRLSRLL